LVDRNINVINADILGRGKVVGGAGEAPNAMTFDLFHCPPHFDIQSLIL